MLTLNKMNKSNIKVSGCIVTHNNESTILEAVTSILEYTRDIDFILYISDNCSRDNTIKILNDIRDNRLVVLENNDNKGFSYGHNSVLSIIKSDYHIIINPDVVVDSDVVSKLINYFNDDSDIAMAMPKILNLDGTTQYLPKKSPSFIYLLSGRLPFLNKYRDEYTMRLVEFKEPTEIDFCSGCFMFTRTDLFKKVNGFDTRFFMYFEDADLTKTMKKYGKVVINPHCYVYHKWERSGARKLKFLLIQISSMFKFFRKWK